MPPPLRAPASSLFLHPISLDNPFEFIVASLCPGILGHELIKAGLILALFGGTRQRADGGDKAVDVRGDPHILVVGDPGLGKSQLLKAACDAAPRGVYVCGSSTTATGLTVTMVRDPVSGDFGLEAGALVLGNDGVCCIDEFDKMTKNEHDALLEGMEQQAVSIAKAGIVCRCARVPTTGKRVGGRGRDVGCGCVRGGG